MPLYKFKSNDIIYNRIETAPKIDFKIYQSKIYYKNADQSSQNSNTPLFINPRMEKTFRELTL